MTERYAPHLAQRNGFSLRPWRLICLFESLDTVDSFITSRKRTDADACVAMWMKV